MGPGLRAPPATHRLAAQIIHATVQVDMVAQLGGQVDTAGGLLEERVWLVGGRVRVVLGLLLDGWVREWGGELLPETLGNSVEWIPIPRPQNCNGGTYTIMTCAHAECVPDTTARATYLADWRTGRPVVAGAGAIPRGFSR